MQTGPKTEQGKAASSMNAMTHGLTSQKIVLPNEDPTEYQELIDILVQEHHPATPTESLLVDEMAQARWRLERVRDRQDRAFEADILDQKLLALLHRYAVSFERSFYKALETLKKLQREARSPFVSQTAERASYFRMLDDITAPPRPLVHPNDLAAKPTSVPENRRPETSVHRHQS